MDLYALGWSSFRNLNDVDTSTVARVTAIHRSYFRAINSETELNLYLSGQVTESLAVGDWVIHTPLFEDEQGEKAAIIKEIVQRKSLLSRWTNRGEQVIAANIDTVFVVTSANQDFNLNRLQRFLLLIKKGGAYPVVILSKSDLLDNPNQLLQEVEARLQIKVITTSIVKEVGINEIFDLMPLGSTSVFVGSSGVGKSSLVNRLLGQEVQGTQGVREDDDKGRHTTTSRQMFFIPGKGLIIDTPGVREVQVFGGAEVVDQTFPEVSTLISRCRFSDCGHSNEPGCAVREAIEKGALEEKEWQNYQKLQREVAFAVRKVDKAESANSKKRWKKINMEYKQQKKFKNKN